MASLVDTLSGLAQQLKTSAPGGLGDLIGGVANTLGGRTGTQNDNGRAADQNNFGLGGLLGSAALGTAFGALLTNKGVRKIAGNALVLGGGAVAATMAWKYFQKWNAGNGQSLPRSAPQTTPGNARSALPASAPAPTPEQEQLAETLLMAMIFAARSDGHIDDQEKANIDMVLNAMQDGGETRQKLQSLMDRPVNPDELAARVRTREEGEDVYRLSCLIVDIDQYMERSYMDGLARALHLSEAEKNDLERQADDMKRQAVA